MKNLLLVLLSLVFALVSCDTDDESPTIFRGEIVFPEGYEKASTSRLYITGNKSRGIGTPSDAVIDTLLTLDNNNRFEATFPAVDVASYTINIRVYDADGVLVEDLSEGAGELDCSPYDCNSIQPGETYDFIIRVVE